ncbi:MAG: ester cyclase [Candidatus Bathyarchaeia archaeon]
MDAVDKFFAVDGIDHNAPPGSPPGFGFMKQFHTIVRAAFPDVRVTVGNLIAEGDKVVCRFTACGTHQGEFMGIPPTGKQFRMMEIRIYRVKSGKIVECWGLFYEMGMMRQLGVILPMGKR